MGQSTLRPLPKDLLAFLASTELLGALDEAILHELEAELELVHLSSGEVLLRQGEPGDSLYVVINGRLRVVIEHADEIKQVVGEVGRGECVGEMALLTGEDRSATVYAIRDTELVKFSKAGFDHLVEKYPQAMMQIARIIVRRLRQSLRSSRPANTLATIAIVPAGREVPLTYFAYRLAATLSAIGPTLHLNSTRFNVLLGKGAAQTPQDDLNNSRIVGWLNEQEMKYRFVIYEADAFPSHWTSRCIRQADRILLVGCAESEATLNGVETQILSAGADKIIARKELVLLHPDALPHPAGTKKWLALRQIDAHHHLRLHAKADFERLTRRLTGRAVGLVLGGGGARGFAHIGVLRALQEAKVPIDLVGGTSMGAIIAAAYAMGWDHQTMLTKIKAIFRNSKIFFDITVPIVSLLTGRKLVKILTGLFGDTQIEDLWLEYFCVSTNLTRAKMVVHREGSLWRSVRASGALPGITPPISYQGDLLVDGAVLNNLPVDVMSELCEGGPVVAVDVSSQVDLATNSQYEESLSGWEVLWNLLNPFSTKLDMPHIMSILMRTTELSSIYVQDTLRVKSKVSLYIRPPVEQFGILDFKSLEKIVDIGYQFAKRKIAAWKSSKFKKPL